MSERFSSKLINYVEPVFYKGETKTAFYSEFGTNFEIGDKVFIVNGNYDSNTLVLADNFAHGADGYKVIEVDRCRIVLDIDYTGVSVFNSDIVDNYIKLNHITSQREFDYINTISTNAYSTASSKFEYGLTNNIIYVGASFSGTSSELAYNTGVTSSGFFQKQTSTNNWINITATFSTGSIFFKTSGSGITYSLFNNSKLLVVGEDITIGSDIYKQRGVYIFDTITNKWEIDIVSDQSYISKLNFRNGIFSGNWNDGIYGSYDQSIDWDSESAIWNSGIFLNSNWKLGTINSKTNFVNTNTNFVNTSLFNPEFISTSANTYNVLTSLSTTASRTIAYNSPVQQSDNTISQSYYSKLDVNGNPLQSTDYSNNKGYGFNYIIDSNIETGYLVNGNFENCNIGLTNYGINAIDVYYGLSHTYSLYTIGGNYNLCDINTAALSNSAIFNSNILNSNISNSKISSNQISNTVASGEYNSDNGINIINADLWSYISASSSQKRGVLKLYISSDDITRISSFEAIYIDRINKELYLSSFDDDSKIYFNYENKYIIDHFNNSEITGNTSSIIVSVKNINDNLYKTYITLTGVTYSNTYETNTTQYASLDIDLGETLAWYKNDNVNYYVNNNPIITVNNVSDLFTNTTLCNAEFNSGILMNSTWKSGDNFNDRGNTIKSSGASFSISIPLGSTNSIVVDINEGYNKHDNLNVGDYVWLNGIDYIGTSSTTNFTTRFKVLSASASVLSASRRFILTEQTNIINANSLTTSGYFSISGLSPNYISINKFKIENSTIVKGLFKSSLILNSNVTNSDFNNLDKNLTISNTSKLRFVNILFKDDNNIINSGLIYKSHLINSTWNNGITFNSIAKGITFSNGIFKNGYWINGSFNNGTFLDGNDVITTTCSYDTLPFYRSWRDGTFNNGQFYNSIWIDGTFNNGRLFNATWYGGVWNNGILGIKNSTYRNTTMGYYPNLSVGTSSTLWNYGVVESGIIGGSSSVAWMDGKFNDGEFFSGGGSFSSIWHNGNFNGGKFHGYAKWKNGYFNKGKFMSHFGWTMSSSLSASDYSWENGIFNGGQFGENNTGTNSTWFNGEFNDGIFSGRIWNFGILHKGTFNGSSLTSSYKNEINFVDYFTQSYYGLWRDGYVSDSISTGKPDQKIYTNIERSSNSKKTNSIVTMNDVLWLNGTFSHNTGTMDNCVWLDGQFNKGTFKDSSFNPFVYRTPFGVTNSGIIISATVSYGGSGWALSDYFFITGGTTPAIGEITGETGGVATSFTILSGGYGYGTGTHTTTEDGSGFALGSGLIIDVTGLSGTVSTTLGFNMGNCVWNNGVFDGGAFYVSEWKNGLFKSGYMLGGVWRNGTWYYGSAENCYWESGTWKNGNWYGTNFDNTKLGTESNSLTISDAMTNAVLYNIATVTGTGSIHILNGFTGSVSSELLYDPTFDTSYGGDYRGWTQSAPVSSTNWLFSHYYYIDTGFSVSHIVDNNYQYLGNGATKVLNGVKTGFTTSIFISPSTYTIEVKVNVFYSSAFSYQVPVQINLGNSASIFLCNPGLNTLLLTLPAELVWQCTGSYSNTKLGIQKNLSTAPGSGFVETSILNVSVLETTALYDDINNNLYNAYGTIPLITSVISLPALITESSGISVQFGNGKFASGVWENGIWNNGYRDDTTITRCQLYPVASYIRMNNNLHRVQLQFVDSDNYTLFTAGDSVSVGNLIAIDINGNRKLLRDKFKVVYVDYLSIVLEYSVNYPLAQITQDSTKHLIYLSKNVWLSGGFLNGYFKGIWNYGLFKGFPYITYMNDSHWIDGILDGGHFKSVTASALNPSTLAIETYNTGLVQNIMFKDNNIASPYNFSYESWMDVNYTSETQTNIYQDKNYFDDYQPSSNPFGSDTTLSKANLNGFITYDVLASNSFFRNGYDSKTKQYSLGVKYKKYVDYLDQIGNMDKLFSSTIPSLGNSNFDNDGWNSKQLGAATASYLGIYGDAVLKYNEYRIFNTDNTLNVISSTGVYLASTGALLPLNGWPYTSIQNYIYLNNTNTENIPNQRYSMIEYDLLSWTGYPGPLPFASDSYSNNGSFYPPAINYIIRPATWSITKMVSNPLYTNEITKREFFYNRHSLLMEFIGGGRGGVSTYPQSFQMDNMHFYEVDMIPFFLYTTESHVNQKIKAPWSAIAPFIDYTSSNFSYIGNVNLTIDTNNIASSGAIYNLPNSGSMFIGLETSGVADSFISG